MRFSFILISCLLLSFQAKALDSYADLVEELMPSVVNISTEKTVIDTKENNMDNVMIDPMLQGREALGSGFFIRNDGYILTNYHVIEGAKKITVLTNDNKSFEASIVGIDKPSDLAVLKVDNKTEDKDNPLVFKSVIFGDAEQARIGDKILAFGNPYGLGVSVSSGIISAKSRNIGLGEQQYLQTDASINRGNSGGPMFNLNGEVIGVNAAIFTVHGASGVGFSLPSNIANWISSQIIETGKRTAIDLGIHGLHPELIRIVGKMKYRSSYGQNLLQHARETANLCAVMASELGLNPKKAKRAGLLHDIGKVPDEEPELPHAIYGAKLAEKYKEKPEICTAIGAHHDEMEMMTLLAPIVQVCDAISGARPGARREIVEAYIKRLNDLENIAMSYPGVTKTYAIQAGRELRVIVGADKINDKQTESLSTEIAKKIQDEMTYPGQVKITVIRETRAVSYAK